MIETITGVIAIVAIFLWGVAFMAEMPWALRACEFADPIYKAFEQIFQTWSRWFDKLFLGATATHELPELTREEANERRAKALLELEHSIGLYFDNDGFMLKGYLKGITIHVPVVDEEGVTAGSWPRRVLCRESDGLILELSGQPYIETPIPATELPGFEPSIDYLTWKAAESRRLYAEARERLGGFIDEKIDESEETLEQHQDRMARELS